MTFRRTIFSAFFFAATSQAAEPSWEQLQCIPTWAKPALEREAFSAKYVLSNRINPFILQGDFNGDGRTDLAVLVAERNSGRSGVAILHAAADEPLVVGAGTSLGAGGTDFAWLNAWSVYPKGLVEKGADPNPPPKLHGDALFVQHLEAASAIIYWDASAYRWYQQGD
jgi:hypothetical protein